MSDTNVMPPGPYRTIEARSGPPIPMYIIPFDANGICVGPRTRRHLLSHAHANDFTDIYVFSHGWNNDFPTAVGSYEHFIEGLRNLRETRRLPTSADYKPLLIGIFWPSISLLFDSEQGPLFASTDPRARDPAVDEYLSEISLVAGSLPTSKRERFYELAQSSKLTDEEAVELAGTLLSAESEFDDELGAEATDANSLVKVWQAYQDSQLDDFSDFGASPGTGGQLPNASVPDAAGLIGDIARRLDPRRVVRLATVWTMKDRAGTVGANGVSLLLRSLLKDSTASVHLIGHSYGCKVLLSATCAKNLSRPVESMLLLQGAISHLCFAKQVPGTNHPGGYHDAPNRVKRPILATYSSDDFPLHTAFHFAVRRKSDLGEVQIAGGDAPPSKFAALGGFGPRECGQKLITIHTPGQPYQLDPKVPVYGLQATGTITGHGDISNPATWWTLHQLITDSDAD